MSLAEDPKSITATDMPLALQAEFPLVEVPLLLLHAGRPQGTTASVHAEILGQPLVHRHRQTTFSEGQLVHVLADSSGLSDDRRAVCLFRQPLSSGGEASGLVKTPGSTVCGV